MKSCENDGENHSQKFPRPASPLMERPLGRWRVPNRHKAPYLLNNPHSSPHPTDSPRNMILIVLPQIILLRNPMIIDSCPR